MSSDDAWWFPIVSEFPKFLTYVRINQRVATVDWLCSLIWTLCGGEILRERLDQLVSLLVFLDNRDRVCVESKFKPSGAVLFVDPRSPPYLSSAGLSGMNGGIPSSNSLLSSRRTRNVRVNTH
jgi:hypothetical protein